MKIAFSKSFSAIIFLAITLTSCTQQDSNSASDFEKTKREAMAKIDAEHIQRVREILGEPNCGLFKTLDTLLEGKSISLGMVKRPIWPYDSCYVTVFNCGSPDRYICISLGLSKQIKSPMTLQLSEYCFTRCIQMSTSPIGIPPYLEGEAEGDYPFHWAIEQLRSRNIEEQ